MKDNRIETWGSKQVAFDKDDLTAMTVGESDYYVICLTPQSRWLLLTLLEFYAIFENRWKNFTDDERFQLHSQTLKGMVCPMACSEDIQAINTTLEAINTTLIALSAKLGPTETDIDGRLSDLSDDMDALTAAVTSSFPSSIFDQIEPILNGVGVILGAPTIPTNGA